MNGLFSWFQTQLPVKLNLQRAKMATQMIFLVCGVALSSWAPMVPFVKDRLHVNDSEMGILLLFLGAGAIVVMPIAGKIIPRVGSRNIVLLATLMSASVLAGLLLIENRWVMAIMLFLFGVGLGAMDVSMNAHGLIIQYLSKKPIMSSLHGLYSVGGIIGPFVIIFLTTLQLQPWQSLVVIAALLILTVIIQLKHLLTPEREKEHAHQMTSSKGARTDGKGIWKNRTIWFLGTMCFIVFLAEGAMLDWSAIFLREYKAVSENLTGLGYAAFSIAMASMRLAGDRIITRVSSEKLVIYGSLTAACGLFLTVFTSWFLTVILGFILVGLGAANIVPILFSESGKVGKVSATASLAAISTMGYTGQLLGPALLGFIAEQTTLSVALIFTAVLLILVAAGYLIRRRTATFTK